MNKEKAEVLIPDGLKPHKNEISAARLLSRHYAAPVKFLQPVNEFMRKTPDFVIGTMECELKTPESNQARKIIGRIRSGAQQSPVIVVDSRKTKLTDKRMTELSQEALHSIKTIRKIILITKTQKVVEFMK
jgi:hypothetical protein